MSRLKTQEEYEKTIGYKFRRWLYGEKDPYIDEVEMVKQHHVHVEEKTIIERMNEKQMHRELTYDVKNNKTLKFFNRLYKAFSIIFVLLITAVLIFDISWLPATGEADKAVNNEVAQRYIEDGLQETGAVNIVSGMILTYRAFDTFGETNVLFIATCCVMIMLMLEEKVLEKQEENNDRRFEPKNDAILKLAARFLCPIIFVFGIYVILNGHLSPGGGFSGGAILGAGMILYASAFGFKKTQRWFNETIYKICKITALCMYGMIGSYFYIMGANGFENHIPLGTPGHILSSGIILPINIAVGIEVACTMYAFFALFRRGGL